MFKISPNYAKLKTNLKLAVNRLQLIEKKNNELALKARKDIADYIKAGKHDRARIRVEQIVRADYLVEAMEMVEMFCDLLLSRFGLIERIKTLDVALEEAVATILWSTPRLYPDIVEIKKVSKQLALKYGKEFELDCRNNTQNKVSEKVIQRMSISSPSPKLIERYMVEIARTYNVPFTPRNGLVDGDDDRSNRNNSNNRSNSNSGGGGGGGGGGNVTPKKNTCSEDYNYTVNHQTLTPPFAPGHPLEPPDTPPPGYRSNPTQPAYPRLPSYRSSEQFHIDTDSHPPEDTKQPWDFNATFHISAGGVTHPGASDPPSRPVPAPRRRTQRNSDSTPGNPGLPSVPSSVNSTFAEEVDFDQLTKRFEQLKKEPR